MLDEKTQEHLDNAEDLILLAPRSTYDQAIVGVASRPDANFVVYSNLKIVEALKETESWSEDDATEYLYYNIVGMHAGNKTPAFLADM